MRDGFASGRLMELRTAHWYSDEAFTLAWPDDWVVETFWPDPMPPLSRDEIVEALRHPVGRGSLADLCRGKRRPLIIIDDLTRPTPSDRILDPLLDEFQAAGIRAEQVTILVATGTHPASSPDGVARKVGSRAGAACRVVVHDDTKGCVEIGKTSFGTPIVVDQEVLSADCIVGIGGIYPNNTAGFGGGPKLALGVLGRRSITHLHLKHRSAGRGGDNRALPFRRDLEEIADAIGLAATVSVHVDPEARPVRVVFGAYRAYYDDEVRWTAARSMVEGPGDADVVVSNAYPVDSTLASAYQKCLAPVHAARPGASRILLASCVLGPGGHGLFPLVDGPTAMQRMRRRASVMPRSRFLASAITALWQRLVRWPRRRSRIVEPSVQTPILLFRAGTAPKPELPSVPGLEVAPSWDSVIAAIRAQHPGKQRLHVVVYPCAALQLLDVPIAAVSGE